MPDRTATQRTIGYWAGRSSRVSLPYAVGCRKGLPPLSEKRRILVAGGYGVFGRLLAKELLASTDVDLVIAGRRIERAEAACAELGPGRTEPLALDLHDIDAVRIAARDCWALACTAGPFQDLSIGLPAAAVDSGANWFDISDDAGWVLPLLADASLHSAAVDAGVVVIPGLSSVPALSGVLARWCRERLPQGERARVILYVGNRNPKGSAAVASALMGGFRNPETVQLPIGTGRSYLVRSPDSALLRRDLGLEAEFRVALEWGFAGRVAAGVGRLEPVIGVQAAEKLGRVLSGLATPVSRLGSDAGCLQVEIWDGAGQRVSSALIAGQRLAVLPCALGIKASLGGSLVRTGVLHPAEWQSLDEWAAMLEEQGVHVLSEGPGS
ncbi:MAG: saccharopine dehydrogenase NADP-binding domain-containing protein [Actinomycetota bacterium]